MVEKQKEVKANIENEKLCAILSYLVIGIIWFFVDENMKKSKYSKFHVKQAMILVIVDLIFSIVASIPLLGWAIAPLLYLVILILAIIGIINAANMNEYKLPIIGGFAEKLTF